MHQARAGGGAGVVLDLVTEALDAIAVGQDPRPVVCRVLGDALGADAAGFVTLRRRTRRVHLVVPPDPTQVLAEQLFRTSCADPPGSGGTSPRVDRRIAWLSVPPTGDASDVYVFVRCRGFGPDALLLLRYALAPTDALARVHQRTTPLVEVLEGPNAGLTAREREVLRLLSEGLLARTIAARLDVSPRTVHHHLGSIYSKLGVCDRLSAVLRARGLGLLDGVAAAAPAVRPVEVPVS
jgi:DNA-binding CsgD family transcriptional regulator